MDKKFGINMMSRSEGGVAYSAERQHGNRTDLFVNVEKANENKKTVLKNILSGTVAFKGIDSLLSSAESGTLQEEEFQNSLDTFVKGVAIARSEYLHPLVNGIDGRIGYMLSEKLSGITGYDAFIEADKIAKDLAFYEKISPDDALLESGENREAVHKVISEFQELVNLYMNSAKGTEESAGVEIEVRHKSEALDDESFKKKVLAVCAEVNDILMDLKSSTVSKNFSEINILLGELKQTAPKESAEKLGKLKSLVEGELDN